MYGIYENGAVIARFTAPLMVRSNRPVLSGDALSLKRFTSTGTAQRWEIECGLEPLSLSAGNLMVHLVTKGHSEQFTITFPQNYGVSQATKRGGAPTANGSINTTTVTVANHTGTIPSGTFLRFADHSKIYMTTTTLVGNGTLSVFPPLRKTLTASIGFNYTNDVFGNFYYDTDVVSGMVYSDGILMSMGTVRLVEAL